MKIVFVNQSSLVPAADFSLMVKACAAQSLFDLMPIWNEASVDVTEADADPGGEVLPIILFDDSDAAGALGYHDETPDGRPYARVFTRETLSSGGTLWQTSNSVSVTMSHEMCEAIVDPHVNLWAGPDMTRVLYAVELCDAVEGDSYPVDLFNPNDGNKVAQVQVSDFLTPSWFDTQAGISSVFDKMGLLTGPFSLRPGGYTLFLQGGSISQKFGETHQKKASKSHPAARTQKRLNQFTR
jgi:hypothetical protein